MDSPLTSSAEMKTLARCKTYDLVQLVFFRTMREGGGGGWGRCSERRPAAAATAISRYTGTYGTIAMGCAAAVATAAEETHCYIYYLSAIFCYRERL